MGICYYVACHDCKVKRDLDKLNPEISHSRAEALRNAQKINVLRAGLLVSFMKEHQLHNCTMYPDSIDNDAMEYEEDYDFWGKE